MEYSRLMLKREKIRILSLPENLDNWYQKQQFSNKQITVFKLRDLWLRNPGIEETILNIALEKITDNKRLESYYKHKIEIKKETKLEYLLQYLSLDEYADTRIELVDKIIELDKNIYQTIIGKLMTKYSDLFFDNALRIFIRTMNKKDISIEVIDLLDKDIIRDPQDFSSLVQLLGFSDNLNAICYIYTYFQIFKDNFPQNDYFEGPLLGISYYLARNVN